MPDELTEVDVVMLIYFWENKGDITRWCDYNKRKHLFPSVLAAIAAFNQAKIDVMVAITQLHYKEEGETNAG